MRGGDDSADAGECGAGVCGCGHGVELGVNGAE